MATVDIPSLNALFLHVPKTAGFSISSALAELTDDATPYPVRGMDDPYGAARFATERIAPGILSRRFSFCFVRDPWDWAVSGWTHVTRNKRAFGDDPPGFADFLTGNWPRPPVRNPSPLKFGGPAAFVGYHTAITQERHLTPGDRGEWAPMAFFGRFERLTEDWARICERLRRDIPLPHRNRSDREDYTAYYTDDLRDLVARRDARLIERFGYRFGERN